jgi:signal transduction histidine kinase
MHEGGAAEIGGARILVVDDDEAVCRAMSAGLSSVGYQVVTAHDGATAIAQAVATPPDLAIVDLEMPTSGLDVIRHLKELCGAGVHVIVLTGHDDEARRAAAFAAGTNDFVVKPVGLAELRRRLAAAVRTQREFVETRLAKEVADRRMTYGAEATALLAHDLNNALTVSLGNLQYVRESSSLAGDEREALLASLRALRRMSSLVANFVDIARFEDAAVKPRIVTTPIAEVLEPVLDVGASGVTRGAMIRVECAPDLEARLDAALIERVLHNLVGNATRYCKANGSIVIAAVPWHDHGIVLTVSNTGPQIPEAIQATLFGKYVHGTGGKRGMGLYFCRLVAEAHGGKIECVPTPDGPSFVVSLPGRD